MPTDATSLRVSSFRGRDTNLGDPSLPAVPELVDGRAKVLQESSDDLLAGLLPLVQVLVLFTLKWKIELDAFYVKMGLNAGFSKD